MPSSASVRPTRSPLVDADQIGEDPVGVDDPAVAVAVDDEVAERVDQAAEALLAFLQLPHAVGERLDLGAAARGVRVDRAPRRGPRRARCAPSSDQAGDADARNSDGEEGRRAGQVGEAGQRPGSRR